MPEKDVEGGSPISTLEVNQVGAQRHGAHRTAVDIDPERPDEPYEEVWCTPSRTLSAGLCRKLLSNGCWA